jgi:hypothetical protein
VGEGKGERRESLVEALVCEEDDCLYLEDYIIPVC